MPHIVVEATSRLRAAIDFKDVFAKIHSQLSERSYARLQDLKSRVLSADLHLAGDDPDGEFLVVRLITTNPRPKETEQAMAQIVHDALREALIAASPPFWWQCCVLIETFDRQDYIRSDSLS